MFRNPFEVRLWLLIGACIVVWEAQCIGCNTVSATPLRPYFVSADMARYVLLLMNGKWGQAISTLLGNWTSKHTRPTHANLEGCCFAGPSMLITTHSTGAQKYVYSNLLWERNIWYSDSNELFDENMCLTGIRILSSKLDDKCVFCT